MTERKESASDIKIQVGNERLDVTQLSVSKDIDVEEIYGAGNVMPAGYAINQISYSGDFTVPGDRLDLEDTFFDGNGVPKTGASITITHSDGGSTVFNDVLVTSEGYTMDDGSVTETSYEFIAMSKDSDTEPQE